MQARAGNRSTSVHKSYRRGAEDIGNEKEVRQNSVSFDLKYTNSCSRCGKKAVFHLLVWRLNDVHARLPEDEAARAPTKGRFWVSSTACRLAIVMLGNARTHLATGERIIPLSIDECVAAECLGASGGSRRTIQQNLVLED